MLYIKLFIEREKNIGQSAPECPFKLTEIEVHLGPNKFCRYRSLNGTVINYLLTGSVAYTITLSYFLVTYKFCS